MLISTFSALADGADYGGGGGSEGSLSIGLRARTAHPSYCDLGAAVRGGCGWVNAKRGDGGQGRRDMGFLVLVGDVLFRFSLFLFPSFPSMGGGICTLRYIII